MKRAIEVNKNDVSPKKKIQKKKLSCPPTVTYQTPEELCPFVAANVEDALKRFSEGQEILLLPLFKDNDIDELKDNLKEAAFKDAPLFFNSYNNACKEEYKVEEIDFDTILRPHLHTKELKPYLAKGLHRGKENKFSVFNLAGGMVNHYNSYLSEVFTTNPTVVELFNKVTGTKKWQIHPQRLRMNALPTANDKINALHWETKGSSMPGIIFGISEKRSFVYWEGTSCMYDPDIKAYLDSKGNKEFINIPDEDAHHLSIFKGRRRRIMIPQGFVLIWNHKLAHEICLKEPSLSAFMSPFDPSNNYESDFFNSVINQPKNPYYAPHQYAGLTPREAEVFGLFFGLAGTFWPSRKEVFHLCHQQAMVFGCQRVLPTMLAPNAKGDVNRNVDFSLPLTGSFCQREEKERLLASGMDNIPKEVFAKFTPNATVNILERFGDKPIMQYRLGLRKTMPN